MCMYGTYCMHAVSIAVLSFKALNYPASALGSYGRVAVQLGLYTLRDRMDRYKK